MDEPIFVERIDADLEELMERFFVVAWEDLDQMRTCMANGDFDTLARLGHTAKGTGYGYGMKGMGDIGRDLEIAAKERDPKLCASLVDKMAHYLENVSVEYAT